VTAALIDHAELELAPRLVGGQIDAPDDSPEGRAWAREMTARLFDGGDLYAGLDLATVAGRREAWRRHGHNPDEPATARLVARGALPVGGGMPTGTTGLAFQHNLPEPGTFIENSDAFFASTERNDYPLRQTAFPGLGAQGVDITLPQVGVLAGIRVTFKGSLVVGGTGAVTALYRWPWNGPVSRMALNVNGQTGILAAEGLDYRARRNRVYRHPREEVSAAPATEGISGNPNPGTIANGTYPVTLVYDVPITHDDYNLIGALYAQSDANQFFLRIDPAAVAEVFTVAAGGTVNLTGNYHVELTFFDIPAGDSSQGRQVILPNMSWLHGLLGFNQPFANAGEVEVALIRTSGQLLATYLYMDNGGAAQIDPLVWDSVRVEYGANRRSREFRPMEQLIEKNVHDYNGRLKPGYVLFDNEVDNPVRDLVYPRGVTGLKIVATIATGTTINANARAHAVEETMYPAR
jgi:hypothetical protein